MNDEAEGATKVLQDSHPTLTEEQEPPEGKLGIEQVERGEQFEALEAPNAALLEVAKADVREEGREVGDSSSLGESSGEVIVGAEVPIVKDVLAVGNEIEGEDEAALGTAVEKEDGLITGVEVSVPAEVERGESSMAGEKDEKFDGAGETQTAMKQYDELNVVKKSEIELKGESGEIKVEENKESKMEERLADSEEKKMAIEKVDGGEQGLEVGDLSSPVARSDEDIVLGDEVERKEEVLPATVALKEDVLIAGAEDVIALQKDVGGEEEKLDGDRETQTDTKQNDVVETAKVDEKMRGDREMEEAGGSQLNADEEMVEDGKTKASGTEISARKESEIDLKEESEEMEEVKMEVDEEGQREAKEDKEMDGEVEKETEDEERKVAVEEEKQMEEDEREEAPKSGSGKRKRGRNSKSAGRAPPRKTVGEDVCFICLDGGDLVLCDRRACPKAYHPSCVDRDEAFFRSKGRWDCGWHLCRQCKKNAHYMCYMCQFSLCKGCLTDDASFFCVRGSKGLCQTCMKSVMLIENNEGSDQMAAFDDTSSMEYLFKDYWTEQKENLSLTSDEIAMLINQWKRSNADHDQEMLTDAHARDTEGGVIYDSSLGNAQPTISERKKSKKQLRSSTVEVDYDADGPAGKAEATGEKKRGRRRLKSQSVGSDPNLDNSSKDDIGNVPKRKKANKLSEGQQTNGCTSSKRSTEWASKELLEFVAHEKYGDKSALSQFDVQELLLEYVKRNKLRDPRRTGQIVCDAMLQKLFGKPRVGHIEMLKLLESHFLSKEDSQGDDNQGSVLDAEISQLGNDENTDSFMDVGRSKGRKARKRGDNRGLQSNLDDYAAIDVHNIKLIYLRRNLIEAHMEDMERFHEKVVGSFVRIRITGSSQKQEIHRLVQIIGTPKVAEPYKVGKRTADCMLEILNLNKTEVISIDTISNQDFDEDECKRLRQSIKCGFLSRLTVGDVLDKAKDLHVVRVTDLLEKEITRLNHLRDRASDLGRKKQLRECVEKLQLLNTPEERQRRLDEIPEVHADPNMDPSHESGDESESDKGRDIWRRETWREREHFPSRKGSDSPSTDPRSSAARSPSKKWEPIRSLSGKGFSSRPGDAVVAEETLSRKPWSPAGDKMSSQSTGLEKLRTPSDSLTGNQGQLSETRTNQSVCTPSETSRPPSASLVQNEVKINETEKLWHYKDPSGKVQGPFSVVQLRKWNKSGYFPATLKIWRTAQSENDSMLLSEALAGRSEKEPTQAVVKPVETPSQQVHRGQIISTLKVDQNRINDQLSPTMQRSQTDPRFSSNNASQNRPTSSQSVSPAATGRTRVSRWSGSPTPVQLPSTATPTPDSSQVSRSSTSPSYEQKRAFDRSETTQQPSREAVNTPRSREDERVGLVYAQHPSSQSTHHTLQSVTDNTAAAVSTNLSVVQPSTGQNPAASAHGWTSSGHILNPNLINTNPIQMQGQQQQPVYSHWQNTPANNLPPPPPYSAGQTTSSATFPAQSLSNLPSQAPWTPQVPAAQPNQGLATTQLPGNAGWAQMQAYINMGWVAPSGPSPFVQYGSQAGAVAGAVMAQASGPTLGMQPGNMNPAGWLASAAAAATNPGVGGPWNWQPPQGQGQGMVAPGTQIPKGQKACPYLMQGHCKKGAACDFRHN